MSVESPGSYAGWRTATAWPSPTAQSRQWTVRYALFAYLASWVVIGAVSLGMPFGLSFPPGSGALSIDAAWLLTLVPLYRSGRVTVKDIGLRAAPGARSAGLALLVWLGYRWFSELWADVAHPVSGVSPFSGLAQQSTSVILVFGAAAVISPVVEEVFFRGLLYRAFRNRLSIAPASVVVGLMFALIHTEYPLEVLPDLLFLGIALCLLYEQTGSLLPGIAVNLYLDVGGFESALTGYSHVVKATFIVLLAGFILGSSLRRTGRRARSGR